VEDAINLLTFCFEMEDNQFLATWKMTSIFWQNGRQPQIKGKWKTT
jgi:hypothetical protein